MRQRIRHALVLVSFLAFPVTIYWFSPVLAVAGAYLGVATGSMVVFAAQFASALLVGRLFCGWMCPAAGLQEACFAVRDRRVRVGRLDWIKYAIWAPWVAIVAALAACAGGFHAFDPLFGTAHGISVAEPGAYVVYFPVVALIVLPAFAVGRRGFCHCVCWMAPFMVIGRKIRNLAGWPALRLKADASACAHCSKCTRACPMSLDVEGLVSSPAMEHAECVLCGSCVDACPKGAISFSFSSGAANAPRGPRQ